MKEIPKKREKELNKVTQLNCQSEMNLVSIHNGHQIQNRNEKTDTGKRNEWKEIYCWMAKQWWLQNGKMVKSILNTSN